MKSLKLIGLFVAIIGATLLAVYWDTLFPPSDPTNGGGLNPVDVTKECDRMRNSFKGAKQWDEAMYTKLRKDIDQKLKMKIYSTSNYNTIRDALVTTSINTISKLYTSEMEAGNDSNLKEHYKGLTALKQSENVADNPKVKELDGLHKHYCDVRSFVDRKSHVPVARFDTTTRTWVNYYNAHQYALNRAASLRNDNRFNRMSKIAGFTDGLADKTINDQFTNAAEKRYYEGVRDLIIAYIQYVDPTEENVNKVDKVIDIFSNEADKACDRVGFSFGRLPNEFTQLQKRKAALDNKTNY